MLRHATALMVMISALAVVTPAHGHLVSKPESKTVQKIHKSQSTNLAHVRHVCENGARKHKTWSCKAVRWLKREWKETLPPSVSLFLPSCTRELVGREGGWSAYAVNPTSGAYGAPQALPGHKMASAGADWRTNIWTQIRWMIGYVNERYGSMCNALAFQISNGYY